MKTAGRTLMEVATAPEVVHYSGKLIPTLFECPSCLKNMPKYRLCPVQYRDIVDHFALDEKKDFTASSSWEDDDEKCSHRYSDRMREVDGMAAYTKVAYVDVRGDMIQKGTFLEKDFMSSDAAKYPRMRLVLQKSNVLIFKFLQKLKLSKSMKLCQFKTIENFDEIVQQEFAWFKKVWVSKTFHGKILDAHGTEVLAINLLDISMDLCDECCVTIDVSIVTKLDRSKGELVPIFPTAKAPVLSPKKSLAFSRLGLGLSCHPKLSELDTLKSPAFSSKSAVQELSADKKEGLTIVDFNGGGKLSPILTLSTTLNIDSPMRNRMSGLTVRPAMFLRKIGSPVPKGSPKVRGGSPSPNLLHNHQEDRQDREQLSHVTQLWSREPVLMPSLKDSMKKASILKEESSTLLG